MLESRALPDAGVAPLDHSVWPPDIIITYKIRKKNNNSIPIYLPFTATARIGSRIRDLCGRRGSLSLYSSSVILGLEKTSFAVFV